MWVLQVYTIHLRRRSVQERFMWQVSYAYWTVHRLDIWIKVDQLDDTCFIIYCWYPSAGWTTVLGYHITNRQSRYITPARLKSVVQPALGYHITNRQSRYITPARLKSVVQPALGYHITNRQSRYITPARLKSAYTTQQVVASFWRWTY